DVQQISRSMYELRVSSVFASNAENEHTRRQATRIDVLRLYSLFGHRQGQTLWTPAERALACFADLRMMCQHLISLVRVLVWVSRETGSDLQKRLLRSNHRNRPLRS